MGDVSLAQSYLIDAIKQVIEPLVGPLVGDPDGFDAVNLEVGCEIDFRGCIRGQLRLSMSLGAAQAMGRAILNQDTPLHSEDLADVVCEVTNLVAGSTKTRLGLANAEISLPRLTIDHGGSQRSTAADETHRYRFASGLLLAEMTIEPERCQEETEL